MKKNILKTITILSIFICVLAMGYTDISEDILHEPAAQPVKVAEAEVHKDVKNEPVNIKVKDADDNEIDIEALDEDSYSGFTFISDTEISGEGIRYLGANIYAADSLDAIAEFSDVVECVEPSYNLKMMAFSAYPDDEYYSSQGNLQQLKVPAAWSKGLYGSSDVKVAVIDSGFTFNHPDMDYSKVMAGKSYVKGTRSVADGAGHGTLVASIIAANQNNGIGVAGIAPGVTILPLRIFDAAGNTTDEAAISAILDAVEMGADVINMSFGGKDNNRSLEAACKYADSKGCILVAAAGNEGTSVNQYPAAYTCVIGVGSIDGAGKVSTFSERGTGVYVTAPGERMSGLSRLGSYIVSSQVYRGTSFACPEVSALAAMAKSVNRSYTSSDFKKLLRQTSDNTTSAWNKDYGYGAVNFETAGKVLSGERDIIAPSNVSIEYERTAYTGKSKKPEITVTYNGRKLAKGEDYSVIYANNVEIGNAYANVSGLGRYGGTVKVYFEIFDPEIRAGAILSGDGEYTLPSYVAAQMLSCLEPGTYANVLADEVNVSLPASFIQQVTPYTLTISAPEGYMYLGSAALEKLGSMGYENITFYIENGEVRIGTYAGGEYIDLMDGITVTAGVPCESSRSVAVNSAGRIFDGTVKDGYLAFDITKSDAYTVKSAKTAAKDKLKSMKPEISVSGKTVSVKTSVSQLKKTGYTVKYKYYRSTSKTSGYSMKKKTSSRSYTHTGISKGKKYYFKIKICVYDGDTLIGSTSLGSCAPVGKKY